MADSKKEAPVFREKKIDEGGFAFPRPALSTANGPFLASGSDGMSMRDWFAGQALQGIVSYSGSYGLTNGPGELAERAYQLSDAMIAARKAGA